VVRVHRGPHAEKPRLREDFNTAQRAEAGCKLAANMNPTAALVIFLVIYALVGAVFAFNI
jgi:hypothetical protein